MHFLLCRDFIWKYESELSNEKCLLLRGYSNLVICYAYYEVYQYRLLIFTWQVCMKYKQVIRLHSNCI